MIDDLVEVEEYDPASESNVRYCGRIISIMRMVHGNNPGPRYVLENGEEGGAIHSFVVNHDLIKKVVRFPKQCL